MTDIMNVEMVKTCTVKACGRAFHAHGLCHKHYKKWLKYKNPLFQHPLRRTVPERFYQKFIHSSCGCWIWTAKTDEGGYGRMRVNGTFEVASRISYRLYFGEIPNEILVLHRCDIPQCVNPKHLFLGTYKDNAADRDSKGRGRYGWYTMMKRMKRYC